MKNRRILGIISLVMCLVMLAVIPASAATELTSIKGTLKTTVKIKKSYPDNPVIEGRSATTGRPVSSNDATPIVLVIDNAPEAHPHWGVGKADILFQIPNAGAGATKILALFSDQYPEQAGGVRSARASMVPIAACFNAAFAFAGGPEPSSSKANYDKVMAEVGIKGAGKAYNLLGKSFKERLKGIKSPHNLSAHIAEIHRDLIEEEAQFEIRPFLFTDEERMDGADAGYIKVLIRGSDKSNKINSSSTSVFCYSEEKGTYTRENSSGVYVDRDTNEALTFANVIVLRTGFSSSGGSPYLSKHLTGSGPIEIFQNGKYVRGAWYRKDKTSRLVLIDSDGNELKLQRGKSFIVVTNEITEVKYAASAPD